MLGVKRNKVILSPHDEDWPRQYQITKCELVSILGDNIVEIYHIGSTAISGIAAKPILDVALIVKNIESLNIAGMEAAGYDHCGEDTPGRYLFVKREDGDLSTHHIHCYPENSENLKSTLLFCKYLNEHPVYAKEYNDLKLLLASKYPDDRVAYTDAKAEFIEKVINLAKSAYCRK